MGAPDIGLAFVGYLLAAAGFAAVGISLLRQGYAGPGADRVQRLVLTAICVSLAWALAGAFDEQSRLVTSSFVLAGLDTLRIGLWLGVLVSVLRPTASPDATANERRATDGWPTPAAAALVLLSLAELGRRMGAGLYEADASRLSMLLSLGMPVLGLVLIEQIFRNLHKDMRWSAKPVGIGLGAVFIFDIYLFAEGSLLGRLDPDVLAVRPLAQLLLVPLMYAAAARRTDWARSIQVSRRAVFYSATLLLSGAYLVFLAVIGYYVRYFGGDWGRALQTGLLFVGLVGLVVLGLSASLRAKVRVFIGKHLFSYRYDYREEWLAFTATLSSESAPQEVGVLVVRALANIVECPAGSLWTRSEGSDVYRQAACWNVPQRSESEPADSAFIQFLSSKSWVIDLAEARADPRAYDGMMLPPWLIDNAKAWAVIPLAGASGLLGFVVLAPPRTEVELNWETRDLLKTAGRQAAGYLAQMRATEALLEARKFDAFNRMSAFVVHDLKNIVTQLSLMLKNAQRLRNNPEFQEDMLLTVESSLEKMRRLMLQLREGVAPPGGTRGVDLSLIVDKLAVLARQAGRQIEIRQDEALATRGHDDRLERVLGHLVQNALDATPASGRVWVHVARYSGQVRVEIGDTGQGMSDEFIRTRLFKPFASTKSSGMGIGSYESAQYIRELGGSIQVDSELGRGTVLTVLLPLFDLARGADLQAPAVS